MWKIETERADLFDINMIITMNVKVSDIFSKEKINDAFNNSVKSFEILNTKVIIDDNGNSFYKENNQNNNKIIYTSSKLNELINEQERVRFHIEDGEYLRLFISDNNFTFMLHHLGGDGKSLLYFIESFFKSLNDETLEYNEIKLLNKETLPKFKTPLLLKMFANYYNKKWLKEKRIFNFDDMDKSFNSFWSKHKTIVKIDKLEENELNKILKECKDNNIGYTSYDIANRIKGTDNIQDIGLAVDGRIDNNRTMSNQATGISVKYKYNKNKSIIENATKINELMKKKLNSDKYKYFILHFMSLLEPTLIDAINLEYTGYFHSKTTAKLAKIMGYGYNTKDLSITNLTKVDIKTEYNNFKIEEIIFIPPVVSYGKNIIGIITTNNKLVNTLHYYE